MEVGDGRKLRSEPVPDSQLLAKIEAKYDDAMNPRYAAARLWVDGIIDPLKTREVVARSLAAACEGDPAPFATGVLQT